MSGQPLACATGAGVVGREFHRVTGRYPRHEPAHQQAVRPGRGLEAEAPEPGGDASVGGRGNLQPVAAVVRHSVNGLPRKGDGAAGIVVHADAVGALFPERGVAVERLPVPGGGQYAGVVSLTGEVRMCRPQLVAVGRGYPAGRADGVADAVGGGHHRVNLPGSDMEGGLMGRQPAVQVRDGRAELGTQPLCRQPDGGGVRLRDAGAQVCQVGGEARLQLLRGEVHIGLVGFRDALLHVGDVGGELCLQPLRGQPDGGSVRLRDAGFRIGDVTRELHGQLLRGEVHVGPVGFRDTALRIGQVLGELRLQALCRQQELAVVFLKQGGIPVYLVKVGLYLTVGNLQSGSEPLLDIGKAVVGKGKRIQVHVTGKSKKKVTRAVPLARDLHDLELSGRVQGLRMVNGRVLLEPVRILPLEVYPQRARACHLVAEGHVEHACPALPAGHCLVAVPVRFRDIVQVEFRMAGEVGVLLQDAAALDAQHVPAAVGGDARECLLVGVEVAAKAEQLAGHGEDADIAGTAPVRHAVGEGGVVQVVVRGGQLVAYG